MTNTFDSLFDEFDATPAKEETVIEATDGQSVLNPLRFILAGNATFTLRSRRTGTRFTYRVNKKDGEDFWFVKVLTGPENTKDYTYLGNISVNGPQYLRYGSHSFWHSKKQQVSPDAPSAKAFAWAFRRFVVGTDVSADMDFFHAGSCARCGRTLTTPESIARGWGPECWGKV